MLGIGAIIVAVWFYLSVQKARLENPWAWVAAGVVIYYLSGALWIHGVLKALLGNSFFTHKMSTQLGIKASGILVGLLVSALLRWKLIVRPGK